MCNEENLIDNLFLVHFFCNKFMCSSIIVIVYTFFATINITINLLRLILLLIKISKFLAIYLNVIKIFNFLIILLLK